MGMQILDMTTTTDVVDDDFLPIARVSDDANYKLATTDIAAAGAQVVYQFLYDAGAIVAPTGEALATLLIELQGSTYTASLKFNDTRNSMYVPLFS